MAGQVQLRDYLRILRQGVEFDQKCGAHRPQCPRQSIPAVLSRALAALRMAPGLLVAADGALRAGLRRVMMPRAYHTHLRTFLRRPETKSRAADNIPDRGGGAARIHGA
ncbi:MAG: hypothetical protein R6V26_05170 [Roseovarius sp.]